MSNNRRNYVPNQCHENITYNNFIACLLVPDAFNKSFKNVEYSYAGIPIKYQKRQTNPSKGKDRREK